MCMEDVAFVLKGWMKDQLADEYMHRRMTLIIADTTNKSFGGKGVSKAVMKMWPIHGDKKQNAIDEKLMNKLLKKQKHYNGNSKA